jgi:uncharacterized membrane protein
MTSFGNLWAIGYDDVARADQVREMLTELAWVKNDLVLEDVAVVVRHPDGSFSFNREPFPAVANILGCTLVGFLAGLVMAVPLSGATVGAFLGGAGTVAAAAVGIQDDFVREVEGLMKPETSALLVLEDQGDMDVILHAIRGWGGTVLKTNVDLGRARLIQATLAAGSTDSIRPDGR